jgi:hypothetical protein
MKPRTVRRAPAKAPVKWPARPQRLTVEPAVERRRTELRARAEEAEADYTEAEAERAEAEGLLDANQHQVNRPAGHNRTAHRGTRTGRQQLRAAQRQTSRLERGLDRAARTAAIAQRRRDAQQQRLANLDS